MAAYEVYLDCLWIEAHVFTDDGVRVGESACSVEDIKRQDVVWETHHVESPLTRQVGREWLGELNVLWWIADQNAPKVHTKPWIEVKYCLEHKTPGEPRRRAYLVGTY